MSWTISTQDALKNTMEVAGKFVQNLVKYNIDKEQDWTYDELIDQINDSVTYENFFPYTNDATLFIANNINDAYEVLENPYRNDEQLNILSDQSLIANMMVVEKVRTVISDYMNDNGLDYDDEVVFKELQQYLDKEYPDKLNPNLPQPWVDTFDLNDYLPNIEVKKTFTDIVNEYEAEIASKLINDCEIEDYVDSYLEEYRDEYQDDEISVGSLEQNYIFAFNYDNGDIQEALNIEGNNFDYLKYAINSAALSIAIENINDICSDDTLEYENIIELIETYNLEIPENKKSDLELTAIEEALNEAGYNVEINDNYILIENWTSIGEDVPVEIDFDRNHAGDDILEYMQSLAYDFDIDDHVEPFVEIRGTRGVPSSISAILESAKEVGEMYQEIADIVGDAVGKIYQINKPSLEDKLASAEEKSNSQNKNIDLMINNKDDISL